MLASSVPRQSHLSAAAEVKEVLVVQTDLLSTVGACLMPKFL